MNNWETSAETILTSGPVVPIIVIQKLEHAVSLAKVLVAGGDYRRRYGYQRRAAC